MARLNEPPMSTDSLETLRRKFLRQNKDIARINSTQSLKIRSLENECARLLSENLQLRSDVLRLKSELEGSQAHRVAEHALQIKEKMEAQLVEWGTMLASLGHEPVPKNRSPRAVKKARIQRDSIGRSRSSEWRRRETMSSNSMQELEAAAIQEGRLPPLWENKTYPRETLSQAEILALRTEAEESTDSPDLGPPPVSRFVDEDPVKFDLPTLTKLLKPALGESDHNSLENTCRKPVLLPGSPAKSTKEQDVNGEEPNQYRTESTEEFTKITSKSESEITTQAAKAGLKRKIREDDKENGPLLKPQIAGAVTKNHPEKLANEKSKPTNRPIRELPTHKSHAQEKSLQGQRKPLGAKSSNEALGSPKKSAKALNDGKGSKPKAESRGEEQPREQLKRQQPAKIIEIPPPSSPEPVIHVDIEPESLSAEPNLGVPDTPEPSAQKGMTHDTPPPADISSQGETTRGSRRARAAVSYAEPNLRDKMRRPNTKQLFDAVAGEGKNIRRTSQCQRDEPHSVPSSVAKSAARSESRKDASSSHRAPKDGGSDTDIMASPLVQKTSRASALEELPASVTTDRKKKDSVTVTAQDHENEAAATKPLLKGANRRLEKIAAREAEIAKIFDGEESDVYNFTESSPTDVLKEFTTEEKSRTAKGGRQARSRRLSSMAREDLQLDGNEKASGGNNKPAAGRKRASMAAIRPARNELDDSKDDSLSSVDADSSVSTVDGTEGAAMTTREKSSNSRRRTTMI